ncbi:hypothetical protein ACGFMK_23005, partial [Amycolatopsis sp. NPDC049252]|uniref:hypothetical protein n=1 Tax=Amycolatopsis sp. NPDC049252 TaxID=3363933 RepID=UPI0037149C84
MTGAGRERERRRRTRSLLGLGYMAGLSALLGPKAGWVPAAGVLLGTLALVHLLLTLVVRWDLRKERRRRAAGDPPSWPAQLPVSAARLLGAKAPGRHARRVEEVGELLGRLTLAGGELRWALREGDRRRGVGPLVFDRSWAAEVVPRWGPGRQGCLTLTHPGGTAVDVWIRDPADLGRVLAGGPPSGPAPRPELTPPPRSGRR